MATLHDRTTYVIPWAMAVIATLYLAGILWFIVVGTTYPYYLSLTGNAGAAFCLMLLIEENYWLDGA